MTTTQGRVAAPCTKCRRDMYRTPDEWRGYVDRDEPPICELCARKVAKEMEKRRRMAENPTARWLILLAILALENDGNPKPSKWDISVRAWNLAPERFSMQGYTYPDTNRVIMELVKMRSEDGHIAPAGESRFALTYSGRKLARELAAVRGVR